MPHLNRCTIMGHLGRDCEATSTAKGFYILRFSVAATTRVKKGDEWTDETEWFRCVALGDRWQRLAERLVKGAAVYVDGRIQTRSWDDKDGQKKYSTELLANDVQMLDGRTGDSSRTAPVRGERPSSKTTDADADSVPF